jgi:hypothetical protein
MADYLEGDLDLTRRALLDAHLDACGACSREFAQMRGAIDLLRSLPNPESPPFLVETVMRRIREGEGHRRFADRLRDWLGDLATPQVALPATALAVGLLMAAGVLDPQSIQLIGFGKQAPRNGEARVVTDAVRDGSRGERLVDLYPPLRDARMPTIVISGPPPVVSGPERRTISVLSDPFASREGVTQMVSNGSNPGILPRAVTRWSARSVRNSTYPSTGFPTNVSNHVVAGPTEMGSSFSPQGIDSEVDRAQRLASDLDHRLEAMARRPAVFAAEFAGLSAVEQQIWLRALAAHARETGRGEELVRELRLSGDRLALQLATAFTVELRQADARAGSEMASVVEDGSAAESR